MSFISDIARQRIQARQAEPVKGAGAKKADGAKQGAAVEGPALRPGGRPAPKKAGGGLSQGMLRQSVGDVFDAGEKVGLPPALLARHLASIETLTKELAGLDKTLTKSLGRKPAETQAVFRNLTGQVVGEMSDALAALDPRGAAKAIVHAVAGVNDLVSGKLPSGEQVRGIIGLAHAAGQLKTGGLGEAFQHAALAVRDVGVEGTTLQALTQQMALAMPTIAGTGGVQDTLFQVTFDTVLKALNGDGDLADIANAQNQAAGGHLNADQVQIAQNQAQAARTLKANLDKQAAGLTQQRDQQKAAYEQHLGGAHQAKLEPLADVRKQAEAILGDKGQASWFQQMNAQVGQPDATVQGLGRFLLTYLARIGREAVPDKVVQQATAQFVALANVDGMTPAVVNQLATEFAGSVDHAELPGVLTQLNQILGQLDGAARGRLLAAKAVEKDGSFGVTALGATLGGLSQRYAEAQGPKNTLVATLNAAGDDKAMAFVARRGVVAAANIPNAENGGIIERLRNHLPADMAALAKAGIDPSAVAATQPNLPADATPRLLAIGLGKKRDADAWTERLGKLFKAARGNKEHSRNLRTLLAAADDVGVDATKLTDALLDSGISAQVLTRTVQAILDETNHAPDKAYLDTALKTLGKKDGDLLGDIQSRLQEKLMQQLNLGALAGEGQGRVTEQGLAYVKGPLAQFFQNGIGKQQVNQDVLKGFLSAVLEDREDAFRFTTPAVEHQIGHLSAEAKTEWMKPQVMMHVRFSDDGEARFQDKVKDGAKLGGLVLSRMEEAWGKLEDLEKTHAEVVAQLRELPKNQRAARKKLIAKVHGVPAKIDAVQWATKVAGMTPETITPPKFQALGDQVNDMRRRLGPGADQVMDALLHTLKMSDISFSQVVTDDARPYAEVFPLATKQCLAWPGTGGEALGYQADPNKRVVISKNDKGVQFRAVMRIVQRDDEGHAGDPMLLLERTYPDNVTQEEKQRLMEHTIRRAADMGIACGFATEYYWDASKTGRRLMDMNAVLEDLSARYGTEVDKKIMKVTNRGGNFNQDYLDSAPPQGAEGRGRVGVRRYTGNQDQQFENEFIVMTPK